MKKRLILIVIIVLLIIALCIWFYGPFNNNGSIQTNQVFYNYMENIYNRLK